jgi:hypothetical protein
MTKDRAKEIERKVNRFFLLASIAITANTLASVAPTLIKRVLIKDEVKLPN